MNSMQDLSRAIGRPLTLVGDLWEFFCVWLSTRRWVSTLILGVPVVAVAIAILVLAIIGRFRDKDELLRSLLDRGKLESGVLQETTEKSSTPHDPNSTGNEVLAEGNSLLCYRRALAISPENPEAKYFVASRYAEKGAELWARSIMEDLAPFPKQGYPPAHSWLAQDLIRQVQRGLRVDERRLLHHLRAAYESKEGPIGLFVYYAQLLGGKGEVEDALETCRSLAKRDARLLNTAALMSRGWGREAEAIGFSEQAALYYEGQLKSDSTNEAHRISASQAYLFSGKLLQAEEILKAGLEVNPSSQGLKRAFSTVLLEQFRLSTTDKGQAIAPDWECLQRSMEADPNNPLIGEQVAMLVSRDVALDKEYQIALQQQVDNGTATPIAYLLMGNAAIKKGEYEQAKVLFEKALVVAPKSTLILNNYAMVLIKQKEPDIAKAKEVIGLALRIVPMSADLWDSQGRVFHAAGEYNNAIASLEKSLAIKPDNISTRRALIASYRSAGLPEMAVAQEEVIREKRKDGDL